MNSIGDWAACATCAKLVQGKRKEALVTRSWTRLLQENPEIAALPRAQKILVKKELKAVQNMFWDNWTGDMEPAEQAN